MKIEDNINDEIKYFREKAKEYDNDAEINKADKDGISDYYRGKADAYRYAALKLKRVLDWYGLEIK